MFLHFIYKNKFKKLYYLFFLLYFKKNLKKVYFIMSLIIKNSLQNRRHLSNFFSVLLFFVQKFELKNII